MSSEEKRLRAKLKKSRQKDRKKQELLDDPPPALISACGPEDARSVLQLQKFLKMKKEMQDAAHDSVCYQPTPPLDWKLDITLSGKKGLKLQEIVDATEALVPKIPVTLSLYGWSKDYEQWVLLSLFDPTHADEDEDDSQEPSASEMEGVEGNDSDFEDERPMKRQSVLDTKESFSRICLSVKLIDAGEEVTELVHEEDLVIIQSIAKQLAATLKGKYEESMTLQQALLAADKLSEVELYCKDELSFTVQAADGSLLVGEKVRDALYSLGIEFDAPSGLFLAPDKEGDVMFVISTETPPPRKFTHDNLFTDQPSILDITFHMNVCIWRQPLVLLDVMQRAARYVAEKTGGVVTSDSGELYTESMGVDYVRGQLQKLSEVGLKPGDDATVVWLN